MFPLELKNAGYWCAQAGKWRMGALILFISDNGRPFPRAKRWLTEEGMRTPWILHWPAGMGSDDF